MIRHYDIKTSFEGDTVILEQQDCGEVSIIHLAEEQLLMLADKLRGIARPSPEDQESRKLRVLAEMILEFVCDDEFRMILLNGQRCIDWLEKMDCLHTLACEFAFGLKPSDEHEQQEAPQKDLNDSDTAQPQPVQRLPGLAELLRRTQP